MRKTYVIYWSRFKRVSRVNLEGHHGVGKRFHGTVCFCFSQEGPANKGQKDGRGFGFVELDDYEEPDWVLHEGNAQHERESGYVCLSVT